jgi:hypothetical protein
MAGPRTPPEIFIRDPDYSPGSTTSEDPDFFQKMNIGGGKDKKKDPGNLTVKGVKATAEQKRNMAEVINTSDGIDNISDRPIVSVIEAVIIESEVQNLEGGDSTSSGILQLLSSTAQSMNINPRSIGDCVEAFHTRGFYVGKGSIQLNRENPNKSPGWIAQQCQGSAYPDRYDTVEAEAIRWLEAAHGGLLEGIETGGGEYRKSYQYERQDGESSWSCFQRLAGEVNWKIFPVGRALYYISEPDLMRQRTRYTITPDDDAIIEFEFDMDWNKPANEATMTVALERWGAPPGAVIILDGWGVPDGRWLIKSLRRDWFEPFAEVTLGQANPTKAEDAPGKGTHDSRTAVTGGTVSPKGGARSIVEQCATLAMEVGGSSIFVVSDSRPGSVTTGGNVSDHAENNSRRAARDIAKKGVNALTGPPSHELDKAVVAIGNAFGRKGYGNGTSGPFQNADTFQWHGYRVQIIWRTPQWGGHMGHIHVGARKA